MKNSRTLVSRKAIGLVMTLILLGSLLAACSPPEPQVIEKVVKETVVQKEIVKEIVKETVIVQGTPQTVEKKVTKVVETVVTATPDPLKVTTGGTIVHGDFSDAESLNPILYSDEASEEVCEMIYSSLIQLDPTDGSILPDLAESWEVSADEKTFTYHLRKDVTWHDGEPFTAEDVQFTYQAILNPDINSPRRAEFDGVLQPENIRVIDDHTVEFQLDKLDPAWLCCRDAYSIIPEHILGELTAEQFNASDFTRNPVGTGPFKFREWVKDDHVALVKYSDYFEGEPNADFYYRKVVENETVTFAQLQTGEVDMASVTAALWEEAQNTECLDCKAYPQFDFLFYVTNLDSAKTPLFQDVRVRQALLYALDRQAMVDSIAMGLATVAKTTVPPISWAHNPDNEPVYPYDPDKAAELLDAAGWRDDDGDGVREAHGVEGIDDGTPFSFDLQTNAGNQEREQAIVVLQQYWKQVGVDAQTSTVEWNALLAQLMETHEYDVIVVGFGWDTDPDQKAMWHTDSYEGGFNVNKYSNPELDVIIDDALATTDQAARTELYYEMQRILAEEVPSAIIYFRSGTWCWNKRLHEFNINDINRYYNAHEWWVER